MPTDVRRAYGTSPSLLEGHAMLVRRAEVVPIEAIVRGYLAGAPPSSCAFPFVVNVTHLSPLSPGSAWAEYQRSGTVHGMAMPAGMLESQRLPEPIFTPSTKAEQGQHDENLSPDQGEPPPSSVQSLFIIFLLKPSS
jgi:phosphoribosylaminoimidazole-succinocarboxamide synthase